MSNVIGFLESLGRGAVSANRDHQSYVSMLEEIELDSSQRDALLDRNEGALSDLLGGQRMIMLVWAPDEKPQREEEPARKSPDEEPAEEPSKPE